MRKLLAAILAAIPMAAPAMAMGQNPAGAQGGPQNTLMSFLPLIVIFVIFYFLLIRPQQKRAKEHKEMLEALKKGDKVITASGVYGLVEHVGVKTVTLKIAENVKVKYDRTAVAAIRTEPDED